MAPGCVSYVLTSFSGRDYKGLFSSSEPPFAECHQGRVRQWSQARPNNRRKVQVNISRPAAPHQVIIRKESQSYRMSAIQNLQTFGKCPVLFFIFRRREAGVGEGQEPPRLCVGSLVALCSDDRSVLVTALNVLMPVMSSDEVCMKSRRFLPT